MKSRRERRPAAMAAMAAMMVVVGACSIGQGETVEVVAEDVTFGTVEPQASGTNVASPADTADPDKPANGGEPISIELWRDELDGLCRIAEDDMAARFASGKIGGEYAVAEWYDRIDYIDTLPRPEGWEEAAEELLAVMTEAGEVMEADVATGASEFDLWRPTPDTELGARLEALAVDLGINECGDVTADETEAATSNNLCDVVPDDMVEAVIGVIPDPEYKNQLAAEGCTWADDDVLFAVQTGPARSYAMAMDFARESGEPLEGLGDEAVVTSGYATVTGGGTRGTTIWVRSGDVVVAVGAMVDREDVEADQLRPVAELILATIESRDRE